MLETKDLSKKYCDGPVALNNLNITLLPGKIYCLVGPNGSGKTTTLRLLASLIKPTSGHINYNGTVLSFNNLDFKTQIGYLPERCGFYNRFSGLKNLEFFISLFQREFHDIDLSQYLKLLDFEKHLNKPVGTYSYGIRQKLGILRTLSIQPKILLLDEPLNGLDIESQFAVKQIIKELRNQQKIILISTHLISTMEDIFDRIIILYEGTKILDMDMAFIRESIKVNSEFTSIMEFYLFHVQGVRHENK